MTVRVPSEHLREWCEEWRPGAALPARAAAALAAYRASQRIASLRAATSSLADPDATGLERLLAAVDALDEAFAGAHATALERLLPLLDAPLAPHPLEAAPERLGARLATAGGDVVTSQRFAARAAAYHAAHGAGAALNGLHALLVSDELASMFADAAEPAHPPDPAQLAAPSTFVAHAAASEANTNAYVVTVRHLAETANANFELYRATLADITDSDDDLPRAADLVLGFDDDAVLMLQRVDPERLELRLVFAASTAYEAFSTLDGSLFDVEPVAGERRLYLRLAVPGAWRAAGLLLDAIWSNLRSCVLLSPRRP